MRIALIIYHADPARGGAERYTADLAAALVRSGHSVSLLATSFAQTPAGVKEVSLVANGLTRVDKYYTFLNLLDAHLAANEYDVVHAMLPVRTCDCYHPHAGIAAAAFPTWKKKLEAIVNPRRLLFAMVEKKLLSGPNQKTRMLCLSKAIRDEAKRRFALSEDRSPLLFNAIDLKKFAPSRRPEKADPNRVDALIIAQDFLRKGVHAAIFALGRLKDATNLHLTVVGRDTKSAVTMKQLAQLQGVNGRVHFVGPTRDPRPHYEAADFFVLPTAHDPCSLVVLEALAMGLPVITTKINGASEIMRDGEHGFIIDSQQDDEQLAECMKMMLDPATRAQMSRACLDLRPALAYEAHLSKLMSQYQAINTLAT